jgi:ring-1,2-phenylacetyl-CoA epoxidase subunit PaaD
MTEKTIYEYLEQVKDPEVPALSIIDLGIVRKVVLLENNDVEIVITPTYSGCPAMDAISTNIRIALAGYGLGKITLTTQLSPAWTTDWMSENGKQKLKAYGIAPPTRLSSNNPLALFEDDTVPCPKCDSTDTELISRFAATSCKSLYKCNNCHEPFEHFKCH